MGNVMAATQTKSDALDATKLGTPEPPKPSIVESDNDQKPLENPGCVEELHKKCKEVQPLPFEGAKVSLNKALSNHFQISHTMNLCATQPSGYRFGATYVGTNQINLNEAFPVLLGEIDPSGNLNANVIHQINSRVRGKFGAQIQDSKMTAFQTSADYRGDDFTATLTVANPNIFNNSAVIVGHYLQAVTEKLALGTEIAYQFGPSVPGGQVAVLSGVGRYTSGNNIWSGSIGAAGVHVCYYLKASEQLQVGVELESSLRMQESVATIGYQVDLPKADLIFKGSLDSNWTVCGVLEKRLNPLPFTFALSGRLNHPKNQFRLGCGILIG